MPQDRNGVADGDRHEWDTVRRCADALELEPIEDVRPLRAGQSGALVVALRIAGRQAVMKVSSGLAHWAQIGVGTEAERAADRVLSPSASTGPVASGLVHGDCHLDNVVRDAQHRFRWIDWQQAKIGSGLGDLVFLWQRAEFAGAQPPRETMITTYADCRGLPVDAAFREALDRTELRSLMVGWPPFLQYGTPAGQQVMRRRLTQLVDRPGQPR